MIWLYSYFIYLLLKILYQQIQPILLHYYNLISNLSVLILI